MWWCMPVSSATTEEFWVHAHPGLYILTYYQQNKTITNWIGKFTIVYFWHMNEKNFKGLFWNGDFDLKLTLTILCYVAFW